MNPPARTSTPVITGDQRAAGERTLSHGDQRVAGDAACGHVGRTDIDLPWERLDDVDEVKAAV
jgi:S-adenosylmethionine synthetase